MVEIPTISIVTPTFNSGKTLEKTLISIKKQSYPQNKIEVLIIDGGSTDNTLRIAKKYGCKIIPNPRVGIIEGEHLGYLKARGKYFVGLAPDEVLENVDSLKIKRAAFKIDRRVKSVLPTGYKTPSNYSPINHYINEFGDPFSFFMYRESKGYRYLIKDLEAKYKKISEDKNCVTFSFPKRDRLPLIELWAGGCMLDLKYAKSNFPQIKDYPELVPLLFYLFNKQGKLLAVAKNDPTIHYSSNSIRKYLKKIRSRVEYNIFLTTMGRGGFAGRVDFEHLFSRYKKFLFIPYSYSLIFSLIDSFYLTSTRREIIYLMHLPLCLYTATLIIYYHLIKTLGVKHAIRLYGH